MFNLPEKKKKTWYGYLHRLIKMNVSNNYKIKKRKLFFILNHIFHVYSLHIISDYGLHTDWKIQLVINFRMVFRLLTLDCYFSTEILIIPEIITERVNNNCLLACLVITSDICMDGN